MRTLFVDFYGTICCDQFWRTLPSEQFNLVQCKFFASNPVIINEWMRGKFTSEEINQLVANKTGFDYAHLWNTFVHDCKTMTIPEGMIGAVHCMRETFHVVLITDNMDCFDRFTAPSLGLSECFDDIANSSQERRLKTEGNGETFKKYLVGAVEDAVLIDDSAENCAFFNRLGGTAHLVTSLKDTKPRLAALTTT